jgi:hypothetical protein
MKFRATLSAMLVVLLGSVVAWAGDPWKEKSYTESIGQEVNRVLEESPWARALHPPSTSVRTEATADRGAMTNRAKEEITP